MIVMPLLYINYGDGGEEEVLGQERMGEKREAEVRGRTGRLRRHLSNTSMAMSAKRGDEAVSVTMMSSVMMMRDILT